MHVSHNMLMMLAIMRLLLHPAGMGSHMRALKSLSRSLAR